VDQRPLLSYREKKTIMKRRNTYLLFALTPPLLAFALAGTFPLDNRDYYTRITATLARELPREHLSRRELNDGIVRQFVQNYITSLDFERIYFHAEDIAGFDARAKTLRQQLLDGDNSFAFLVYETFKQRLQNRIAYIDAVLAEGFDFDVEEEYRWKRRDAPWSANEDEWNELWRQRIKNEYLRQLLLESGTNGKTDNNNAPVQQQENGDASPDGDAEPKKRDDANKTDEEEFAPPQLPPAEFIQNRYKQYQHVMQDADAEWVLQKYLSAFARAFDPHCDYMFPAAAEDFEIEMKLSLVGIGAILRPEDGAARIVSLIPGGPASTDTRDMRLRPGDKIIAVAQDNQPPVSILHWPLYRAVRIIRGEVGTRVVLTVIPASDPSGLTTKQVDLIRDEIKLEEREARSEIKTVTGEDGKARKVGIITLPTFYADMQGRLADPQAKSSSRDVANILRDMRRKKVDAILLDLRNNGGGSLVEAILMTGLFINPGPVVQVRERRSVSIIPNTDPTIAFNGPLAVLVNRVSASASEIVAAALQDYGRAIIIGDSKTHGKGSVQTITPLGRRNDSGSLKVTSALFYRITGGSTQLHGVTPDIVIPSAFDSSEFGEEFLDNPLEWTTVQPAMYSVFSNLQPIIPQLRTQSEQRRAASTRFQAYLEMLERIRVMNESKHISLHKQTRMDHVRTERELTEMQNQLMDQAGGTETDTETKDETLADLVKDEAMHILSDWISTRENLKPQILTDPS
jgi:carboxyl-terminal processing protease